MKHSKIKMKQEKETEEKERTETELEKTQNTCYTQTKTEGETEFKFSIWGNFSLGLFAAGTRTDGVKQEIDRKRETCYVEWRKKALRFKGQKKIYIYIYI